MLVVCRIAFYYCCCLCCRRSTMVFRPIPLNPPLQLIRQALTKIQDLTTFPRLLWRWNYNEVPTHSTRKNLRIPLECKSKISHAIRWQRWCVVLKRSRGLDVRIQSGLERSRDPTPKKGAHSPCWRKLRAYSSYTSSSRYGSSQVYPTLLYVSGLLSLGTGLLGFTILFRAALSYYLWLHLSLARCGSIALYRTGRALPCLSRLLIACQVRVYSGLPYSSVLNIRAKQPRYGST
jgi:hypothetical protein